MSASTTCNATVVDVEKMTRAPLTFPRPNPFSLLYGGIEMFCFLRFL